VRAVLVSSLYSDPARRRKLHELAGRGWTLVAAGAARPAGTDAAIRLAPIPVSGAPGRAGDRRWRGRALRHLLGEFRPAIVQVEEEPGSHAAWVAAREARRLDIPVVLFAWESLPRRRGFLERRRYDATLARAAGLIGGNRLALAQLAAARPTVPARVILQTGVVPPLAPPPPRPPDRGLAMAYVGRLVPERGVDLLLRVAGQLMGTWSLRIAGTGPEQEALEDLVQRLGLASRIRWLGSLAREQVAALWADVDCLVLPSRATPTWVERHSPLLLDAMAHGVAPVVTDTGALPDLVGDAGQVVRTEEDLLIALQQMIADPGRRVTLGQAARQRVLDRYVDAALARATDEFWRTLLSA
jgi:glycosyltransferase involved in cell wall biosynthesis